MQPSLRAKCSPVPLCHPAGEGSGTGVHDGHLRMRWKQGNQLHV